MAQNVKIRAGGLQAIRSVDPRLVSYNVEMTEVTGGTFWKAYTPEEIAGNGKFPAIGIFKKGSLMQVYPPIDLTNPRLRKMAKEIGPVWVRVSGTWSTKTYYDFDGETNGTAPAGFQNVLTKAQWLGVLDFVREVGGKLLVSVANCEGIHSAHEPWQPEQAKKLFDLSRAYGVPIDAAEFMNEPNMLSGSGAPKGYTFDDYIRDQDIFNKWLHENYPETLAVGPCSVGGGQMGRMKMEEGLLKIIGRKVGTERLLKGAKEPMEVFSYHYYNGVSERIAAGMPFVHWKAEEVPSEAYLDAAGYCARAAAKVRDQYMPGAQLWVTESGDAGGGGDTWASTYLDVLRTLNELGSFAVISDGVIFHNTLASSDYGWLHHSTFEPRPNYFAVLLWNRLMGATVYDAGEPIREGAHVYCHSRRDGREGYAYLIINNSMTDTTTVELPGDAVRYTLAGRDGMRSAVMTLNGRELALGEGDTLPDLSGERVSGRVELAPGTCTFIII
ncbi:MAG: beta-glucuronidase [Clostridia bacterium]|nr:beta-glucuronidase [Clostridia bacterium]